MLFLLGVVPLPFSFSFLCVSEFRWNIYCGLSVFVWEYPYVDSTKGVSGVKSWFDVDTSHIFPGQDLLATVTLREWLVLEELNLPGMWGGTSAQRLLQPCQGYGSTPSCWDRNSEGQTKGGSSFKCFPFSPHWGLWSKGREQWTQWRSSAYRAGCAACVGIFRLCSVIAQSHAFCSCGFPRFSARSCHGVSRARAFSRLGLGLGALCCKKWLAPLLEVSTAFLELFEWLQWPPLSWTTSQATSVSLDKVFSQELITLDTLLSYVSE